jgi:hypothetical protein
MGIAINIDRLFRWHLICIGFFAVADIFVVICFDLLGFERLRFLARLFSLNAEQNPPALFSAGALLLTAAVCGLCASQSDKKENPFWMLMAIVFAFLAIDEAVSIHELLVPRARVFFHASGAFANAWVIPYGIALIIFLFFIFGPLMRLPAKTRNGFVLAGILFVTGALGFEMIEAGMKNSAVMPWMTKSLASSIYMLCEETLEMLGIALALRTCLRHLTQRTGSMDVTVAIAG